MHYRAIFISDVHLGSKDCQAGYLYQFLSQCQTDCIYLLGDIVDIWAMQKQVFWRDADNKLLKLLLEKAEAGVKVVYIPGNHDESMRHYAGKNFGSIQIQLRDSHTTLQGKKLLLLHGDEFDKEVHFAAWQTWLGDHLYDFLLFLNRWFNRVRRLWGGHYFSLASYIKSRVPKAQQAIGRYRDAAVAKAKRAGYDGVVCGHIHHPEICLQDGIIYCNDGDWIDNCTALVEQIDGSLSLFQWTAGAQKIADLKLQHVTPIVNCEQNSEAA